MSKIRYNGSIYNDDIKIASKTEDGLMSKEDKNKLDGVEEGANKYIHPDTHPATMITEDETHRFVTDAEKIAWDEVIVEDVAPTAPIPGKDGILIVYPIEVEEPVEPFTKTFVINGFTLSAGTTLTEDTEPRSMDPENKFPYYYQLDDGRITSGHRAEFTLPAPSVSNPEHAPFGTTFDGYLRLYFSKPTLSKAFVVDNIFVWRVE